jgi:hypothetical protein
MPTSSSGLKVTFDVTFTIQPFIGDRDNDHKIHAYQTVKSHVMNNINKLVTFGVVTRANDFRSIEAFRPEGHSTWVVTHVAQHDKNLPWDVA